jgi:lysophospholipase L1-like esterase
MRTERKILGMTCFMGARRNVLAGLLGGLAACGGGSDPSAPVTVAPLTRIGPGSWVVMGSSSAAGVGAPAERGWAAQLQMAYAARGAHVTNIAKGGTVTYEALSVGSVRVAARPAPDPAINIDQALSHRPVLLIVSYPTNDTARGYSVDETVNNLLTIREQALVAGVPVLVTSTLPRNLDDGKLAQLRMIDQRLASSVGACFIEVRQTLAGGDGRLAPKFDSGDGVHPNEAGHAAIALRVQAVIDDGQCVRL